MEEPRTREDRTRWGGTRTVSERPITLTCQRCRRVVTMMAWPGVTPSYCSDACRQEATRELGAARMRRLNQRRGSGSPAPLPGQPMLPGLEENMAAT